MHLQYVSSSENIHPQHSTFLQSLCKQLDTTACITPKQQNWERQNLQGDWLVSRSSDFLNKDSILNYWRASNNDDQGRGPLLIIPEGKLPEEINNIMLAYSSYPDVEETFLRRGMDLALRLHAHLHCFKVVQPPKAIWSKREYAISRDLKCFETISTHESVSSGVLEYAEEYEVDMICLLTRPWEDSNIDVYSSHSLKVLQNSGIPVMLFREDDVQKVKWKLGA